MLYGLFAIFVLPWWILWDVLASKAAFGSLDFTIFSCVNSVLLIFVTGLLTVAVHDICVGNPPSLTQSFRVGGAALSRLISLSLRETFLILIGFVLLILPGVYLAIAYLFSASIVIVEGSSPKAALVRSRHLVRGHFWKCLITYGGCWIFYFIALSSALFFIEDEEPTLVQSVVANSLAMLLTPVPQIVAVLLYYDVRSRKENIDMRVIFAELPT